MDSRGLVFGDRPPARPAAIVTLYERLAREGFSDLSHLSRGELDALLRLHERRLDYYREERRMHFGAFALAGLALVVLLPALVESPDGDAFLPILAVEILLLVLLVPYAFVYRRYEEGLRRMMREAFVLENERALRDEGVGPSG